MRRQIVFRLILVLGLLVVASLACAITDTIDKARDAKEGVETVQSIATQIDESGLIETGQAVATKIDESGIQETAQAAATKIEESGVAETIQAVATEIVVNPEEIPPDIPLMEGYFALVGSETEITYSINEDFQLVVDFYRREMPAQGWSETLADISDAAAELSYEKPGRKVNILIIELPFIGAIQVAISLD